MRMGIYLLAFVRMDSLSFCKFSDTIAGRLIVSCLLQHLPEPHIRRIVTKELSRFEK